MKPPLSNLIGLKNQMKCVFFFVVAVAVVVFSCWVDALGVYVCASFCCFYYLLVSVRMVSDYSHLWQTTLAKCKENIATRRRDKKNLTQKPTIWKCDVCCSGVIHCDSHTSSLVARVCRMQAQNYGKRVMPDWMRDWESVEWRIKQQQQQLQKEMNNNKSAIHWCWCALAMRCQSISMCCCYLQQCV